ncbi:FG-GAP-like repeat-containing protein [Calditrichota bacterium]
MPLVKKIIVSNLLAVTLCLIAAPLLALPPQFDQHTLDGSFSGASSVVSADIDGDGDIDVVGTASPMQDIAWWENDGAESFTKHLVVGNYSNVYYVTVADIDNDGDLDIIAGANNNTDIAWFENDGAPAAGEWELLEVASGFNQVHSVHAIDLNRDGFMDVVAVSNQGDDVAWFMNDGAQDFTKIQVNDSRFNGASAVFPVDLDSNGDIDIIATAEDADKITWFVNDGDPEDGPWDENTIESDFAGACDVFATDLDFDGDIDIVAVAYDDDKVAWFENDGDESFTSHTISDNFNGPSSVQVADMDKDGDLDVVAAAYDADLLGWWENDGTPDNGGWVFHTLSAAYSEPSDLHIADIDRDGYPDLLSTADDGDEITFWRNTTEPPPVPQFIEHQIVSGFEGASDLVTGDFDGDGDIDIAAVAYEDNEVAWWKNDGSESFTKNSIAEDTDEASSIDVADIDSDGNLDLAVSIGGEDKLFIYYDNDGEGDFSHVDLGDGNLPLGVSIFDLDSDGDMDILGTETEADDVIWWKNDGEQSFSKEAVNTNSDLPPTVIAVDMDCDGDIDALSTASNTDQVIWWKNNGSESFEAILIDEDFDFAWDVTPVDLDSDGKVDVVASGINADEIAWWHNDGNGDFTKYIVKSDFDGAYNVAAGDIDGDGDPDLIATAMFADQISWWENDGSPLIGDWTEHNLTSTFDGARNVRLVDLDQDGDCDIIATAFESGEITWWENTQNSTSKPTWQEADVKTSYGNTTFVMAADIDGDGDSDILSCANTDDKLAWHANDGDEGFTTHFITDNFGAGHEAYPADVDGDGDLDVIATAGFDDEISWFRNDGSPADGYWDEFRIGTDLNGANSLFPYDIDGDGDLDLFASAIEEDELYWFENDGSPDDGEWNKETIKDDIYRPACIVGSDIDSDGDIDLIAISYSSGDLIWLENDGDGDFEDHTITNSFGGTANSIVAADMDNDGDIDIAACSASDDEITWWENDGSPADGGWNEHLISNDQASPSDLFMADADNDGDMDIFSSDRDEDAVYWYENDGYPANGGWTAHQVATDWNGAYSIAVCDLDQDGDNDVIGGAYEGQKISWWSNDLDPLESPARFKHSIPRTGFTMIGIPVIVNDGDPATLFGDDVNDEHVGGDTWRISYWDHEYQKYVRYDETDSPNQNGNQDPVDMAPGIGYWINQQVVDNCELDITAAQTLGSVNQSKPFQIAASKPLTEPNVRGLRMLANPFNYRYDWRQTTIYDPASGVRKSIYEAAQAEWISGYAYVWDRWESEYVAISFTGTEGPYILDPWQGFWFEQLDYSLDLKVEFNPATHMVSDDQNENEDKWRLRMSASTADGTLKDSYNYIGVDSRSKDGYDFMDAMEFTPAGSQWVQVYFSHPEWDIAASSFSSDIRSRVFPDSVQTWRITVRTWKLPETDIVLNWHNIIDLPDNYSIHLSDPSPVADSHLLSQDIRQYSDFKFRTGEGNLYTREFIITIHQGPTDAPSEDIAIPAEFGLTALYPNPFNSILRIEYGLPEARYISLNVFDLQGRLIDPIGEGMAKPGYHSLTWDATEFASGTYFIELQSGSEIARRQVLLTK